MQRPLFYLRGDLKDVLDSSGNDSLIHRPEASAFGHRAELDQMIAHAHVLPRGCQLAVRRKPIRRVTCAGAPTALSIVRRSSLAVKPRKTESTPSWRVTR